MPNVDPNFEEVRRALGLDDAASVWRAHWEDSSASWKERADGFLGAEFARESCRALRMTAEAGAAVESACLDVQANPALKRLVWHGAHLLIERQEKPDDWPGLPEALGTAGRMFPVLTLLGGLPALQSLYRERGIPESVFVDTLSDLELWMRVYHKRHGVWGLRELEWLWRHFTGRVFKLGRLQFEIKSWPYAFRVVQHRATREIAVFAPDGARFRSDGQFDGVNGGVDPAAWMAHFEESRGTFRGNPISPEGCALEQPIELPRDTWKCMLQQGDPTLGVHIPAVGPLDHAACIASLAQATEFFARYFPEHPYRVFECDSWLLDNQLPDRMPPESNIVRFQRLFRLLASPKASDAQTLERVFDFEPITPATAPRNTRLRRAILEHMEQGGRWRTALGIRLAR